MTKQELLQRVTRHIEDSARETREHIAAPLDGPTKRRESSGRLDEPPGASPSFPVERSLLCEPDHASSGAPATGFDLEAFFRRCEEEAEKHFRHVDERRIAFDRELREIFRNCPEMRAKLDEVPRSEVVSARLRSEREAERQRRREERARR